MSGLTTRKMSDAHETWLSGLLEGRMTKGSGNQWHNPMDGRHSSMHQHYAFAWDGKSTLGKSIGVSLNMWEKAREQASPEMPLLPLRFYATERLDVALDLVVLKTTTFADILADANAYQRIKEAGCIGQPHLIDASSDVCKRCGTNAFENEENQ